ncbi:hypothetical protein B0H10DRAFT_2229431 [Mycena sp. CBHHK59/15]|nr:hypothetical protein B0H10DRAFT_2229431 [Mycena sp. CBHHK59/15]
MSSMTLIFVLRRSCLPPSRQLTPSPQTPPSPSLLITAALATLPSRSGRLDRAHSPPRRSLPALADSRALALTSARFGSIRPPALPFSTGCLTLPLLARLPSPAPGSNASSPCCASRFQAASQRPPCRTTAPVGASRTDMRVSHRAPLPLRARRSLPPAPHIPARRPHLPN